MLKSKYVWSSLVLLVLGIIIGMFACWLEYNLGKVVMRTYDLEEGLVRTRLNGVVGEQLIGVTVKDGEKLAVNYFLEKGVAEMKIENIKTRKTEVQKRLTRRKEDRNVYSLPEGSYRVRLICKSGNILERILGVGVVGDIELKAIGQET